MLSVKVTRKGGYMLKEMTAKEMGKKGGTQRAKNLTAKQRSDIARKGAKARWANNPTKKGGK